MIRAINFLLLMVIAGCFICGCDSRPLPNLQYLANREQPIPVAHLPQDYRLKNWIGTNDRGSRGGSCFWASVYMCIRHADRPDLEELLIQHRGDGFEGPEHLTSMCRKLDSIGIPWAATEDGDVELLERASDQRRWAAIGYYPGHAICFCGFYDTAQGEIAILLDNNFPDDYIGVPKSLFVDSWKHAYGGMGIVPWIEPAIVNSYPRTRMLSNVRIPSQPSAQHADIYCAAHCISASRIMFCTAPIDQGIGRLGEHSIWSSLAETGDRCLRTRHWASPRHEDGTEVLANTSQQRSTTSTGCRDAGTDLRTTARLLASADRCDAAAGLCSYRSCVSELSKLSTQSLLFPALPIRRWALWQHRQSEFRIPAIDQQFAAVA